MNNKNATPKRVIYTSPSFPCRCEVLGDELCNDLVVIRCVDESSGAEARMSMSVYDAKFLSDDILSGGLESMASLKFENRHGDYGIDDFIDVYCDCGGGSEFDDYGVEQIVSRQMSLSATCAGIWKIEVIEGKGIADDSGNVYLYGAPESCVSAIMTRKGFLCLGHALSLALSLWGYMKLGTADAKNPA